MSTHNTPISRKLFLIGIMLLAGLIYTIFFASFIDAQTTPITTLTTDHDTNGVAWSPDGELIAVGSFEGIYIYDTDLQEVTLLTGVPIISVDWNSDSTMLASAGGFGEGEGRIQVWERDVTTNDFELIAELTNGMYEEFFVGWSPDGTKLASIGSIFDERRGLSIDTFEIWNTESWELDTVLDRLYYDATYTIAWSADSRFIAGGAKECRYGCERYADGYFIANAETGEQIRFFDTGSFADAPTLAWSPQGNRLVTSGWDLTIYDPYTGNVLNEFQGTSAEIVLSPSGIWIARQLEHDRIHLWNMETGNYAFSLESSAPIFSFAWSPDGNRIVATSEEGTIDIWDVSNLPDLSNTPTMTPFPTNTPTSTPSPLMPPSGSN